MITDIEDFFAKGCGRCERFATPACSANRWHDGLTRLRALCRSAGLVETVKWGHPCYMHAGRNIALIGALQGDFWVNSAAIALALTAIAAPILGFVALIGRAGIALGVLTFLLFANPISAAAIPVEFLPVPWGAIGQWFPPGAAATLLRDLSYFPAADATFPHDPYVSAHHCRLVGYESAVWLEDLDSSNGTYVRVRSGEIIPFGSVIAMGSALYRIESGEP